MHVRSPSGNEVPPTGSHPLPAPPRWHLRTQVSRKTLFDLIQDTLPPSAMQVTGGSDGAAIAPEANAANSPAPGAASGEPGVLPQTFLDSLAATVPMPLNPAAMWSDGDTTPDIPEHWRPITITLASRPALPPPVLPLPAPAPRHPLHGIARTAGWMLSGAALTFLVAAAAFGGRPMLRAIRGMTGPAQTQGAPDGTIPALHPSPAPLPAPLPARAPAPRMEADSAPHPTVVAVAERPAAKTQPVTVVTPLPARSDDRPDEDALLSGGDRRAGVGAPRSARHARQDRRLSRSTADADSADSLPGSEDAVMPLASSGGEPPEALPAARSSSVAAKAPVVAKAPSTLAKAIGSRAFRPIDVEDPFGGR